MFACILALFALTASASPAPPAPTPTRPAAASSATLTISSSTALHYVDASFLGVNIDAASLTNRIDLSDAYLTALAVQLSRAAAASGGGPMHLRVGGSASNGLYYSPAGVPGRGADGSTCVTDASLAALDAFAVRAGLRVTLCLPYQTRGGRWDPSINASALWAMVGARNLSSFSGWSLGNELIGALSPSARQQYAADYVAFRAAVSAQAPAWAQDVVGPSAAGWPGDDVIAPFLQANARSAHMSLSIHAYSFSNCSLAAYTSKAGIERMAHYYSAFVAARDANAPGMPVYLEEMATQAGGGCDGLSNRFVSGLWFMHALGLAGQMGVHRVTRQDLAGWSFASGVSRYTLAGPPGWVGASQGAPTPHPDWFAAVLWRQIMGAKVLPATLAAAPAVNDTLAVHAWCAAGGGGAVALAFVNLAPAAVELALAGVPAAAVRTEFFLTPPGGNLTADALLLNGEAWGVDAAGRLPQLPVPGRAVQGSPIFLPPTSYGFLVLPAAGAAACAAP